MDALDLLKQRLTDVSGWPIHIVRNTSGMIYVFSNGPDGRILEAWAVGLEGAITNAFGVKDTMEDLLG